MNKQIIPYVLLSLILLTEDAYAYLDPGTGSMLLQGLVAAIAAAAVAIKLYWHKVKTFLFGGSKKTESPADGAPEEDDSR